MKLPLLVSSECKIFIYLYFGGNEVKPRIQITPVRKCGQSELQG